MAASKRMKNLFRASAASNDTDNQHLVLTITTDGNVFASGSDNMVTGMVGDVELYSRVKACMKDNLTEGSVGYANTHQLAYDPLPCSPFSAAWKMLGNEVIRGLLRKMFITAGYGRGKSDKKLGVGPAPIGWPEEIDWNSYKGSTRSGLKVSQVTQIIVSMLQAAGFDTDTHVKQTEEATADAYEGIAEEETAEDGLEAEGIAGQVTARYVAAQEIADNEIVARQVDAREIDARKVVARDIDAEVLPISEGEALALIGDHIVNVVTVTDSTETETNTRSDSQSKVELTIHENMAADMMYSTSMSIQKNQVSVPGMKAVEEMSQQVDDSVMLVQQAGVKRKFGS